MTKITSPSVLKVQSHPTPIYVCTHCWRRFDTEQEAASGHLGINHQSKATAQKTA